jgi:hypothetical protein
MNGLCCSLPDLLQSTSCNFNLDVVPNQACLLLDWTHQQQTSCPNGADCRFKQSARMQVFKQAAQMQESNKLLKWSRLQEFCFDSKGDFHLVTLFMSFGIGPYCDIIADSKRDSCRL